MPAFRNKFQIYLFCILGIWISGCSITRHIDEGDLLVVDVKFKGVDNKGLKEGLYQNLRFKTNKRILNRYPFYLQAWNFGKDGRDSSDIRTFFREKVGEKPSLLDSTTLNQSITQLKLYLFNSGYFHADVKYEVKVKRKKAVVTFLIDLGKYYTVNEIEYHVYDKEIYKAIAVDRENCLVKTGQIFNTEELSDERERLNTYLRNKGYYFFNKEYISFDIDSSQGNYQVNIAIEVKNPSLYTRHQIYTVESVFLDIEYPYYLAGQDDSAYTDVEGIMIRNKGYLVHKEIFPRYIPLKPGAIYRDLDLTSTYNGLIDIQIFKSVNINIVSDSATQLLYVYIQAIPEEKLDFTIEPQGITSDQSSGLQSANRRIWGLSTQVQFRNNNTFKGAEFFDVRFGTAAEFQYTDKKFGFSNFEQSVSSSITIPKNLLLERMKRLKKVKPEVPWRNPKTVFTLTFTYETNTDFVQRTSLFTNAYTVGKGYNFFRLIPEINLNQVSYKTNLIDSLGPTERVLLSNLLNDNFIPSTRFEWIRNNKGKWKSGDYINFRWNVLEFAGNLWYLGYKHIFKVTPPTDGIYEVFRTNFFQYIKTDFDFRYYENPVKEVRMAYRVRAGLGVPFGNSRIIPFDKRFFIGGANSLRGWRPRNVGPGNFYSTQATQIDRSGEIVLESSAELRFIIIDHFLEGAFFADAGNIWNVRADTLLPGAEFRLNQFYKDLAVNTGVGLRFDFSFFMVRLDLGAQLRDPAYHLNKGWLLQDYNYINRRLTLNFGIGYPF